MTYRYEQQYKAEMSKLQQEITTLDSCETSSILDNIEFDILKPDGRVNWWYIIWNLGKIIARVIFAKRVANNETWTSNTKRI